jgi:Ca2+/Na+ antiporter
MISILFIFVTFTKLSGIRFRFSIFYLIVAPIVFLWYKLTKQADTLGKWHINKSVLFILSPFIIFVMAYSYAATEGTNLKIIFIATLVAILLSVLFSLYKEKDGDFKVTLTLIKSLSDNDLTKVLNTLEESEQKLIIQRFGLENGKPLTIAVLSNYYGMDTTELKDWLSLVDNKLFESITSKRAE